MIQTYIYFKFIKSNKNTKKKRNHTVNVSMITLLDTDMLHTIKNIVSSCIQIMIFSINDIFSTLKGIVKKN